MHKKKLIFLSVLSFFIIGTYFIFYNPTATAATCNCVCGTDTSGTTMEINACLLMTCPFGVGHCYGSAASVITPSPTPTAETKVDPLKNFKLQIPIGSYEKPDYSSRTTAPIGEYIKVLFKYATGVVGILATVVMMFGGFIWITAGGSSEKVGEAKNWITASLTGLLIALGSYMILATVNTDLVNFKTSQVQPVENTTKKLSSEELSNYGTCLTKDRCINYPSSEECTNGGGTWLGNDQNKIISSCGISSVDCGSSKELSVCKHSSGGVGYCVESVCSNTKAGPGGKCGGAEVSGVCKEASVGLALLRSTPVLSFALNGVGNPCPTGGTWVVGGRSCDGLKLGCCK